MSGSVFFGIFLPLVAVTVAVWAYSVARRPRPGASTSEQRIAALEEQVRGLLYRVWTLERGGAATAGLEAPAPPASVRAPEAAAAVGAEADTGPATIGAASADAVPAPATVAASPLERGATDVPPAPSPAAAPLGVDLEQRIGARWATWVGVVALLFAVSFFLKWSLDQDVLGRRAQMTVGLVSGCGLALAGLALHRRRDVPYLSEGLAGLGVGLLYLTLWAGHAVYGLLDVRAAFAAFAGATLLGVVVAVLSSRQATAVLALVAGLLTPRLLQVERLDERNLLVYLVVLDLLVLGIARFRTWPALNRLAWLGSALLLAPVFLDQPTAPNPLSRLVLLSGLFLLFLAVPLLRERTVGGRSRELDLVLVVANAAGYFWVVYLTLEGWHPGAEGGYALALAIAYRAAAADYAARVPGDETTVVLHEAIAWTFLTIAVPLALGAPWVTLAWAVQGAALLWVARRAVTPVAAWGGVLALLLAGLRVVAVDQQAPADTAAASGLRVAVHVAVVALLALGGAFARGARPDRVGAATAARIRDTLWVSAAIILAVLLWREPAGLWPSVLLTGELLVVAAVARVSSARAFAIATPLLGAILLARVMGADDLLARTAAFRLVNRPLLSRVVACGALAVAGRWLARSAASPRARALGRIMAGAAAVVLLVALSANWTWHQAVAAEYARAAGRRAAGEYGRNTQVGLSVLWTIYAAAALGWGFARASRAVRFGALALFGLTVLKVFVVDLSAVRTAYRIVSFLILGLALLLVSVLYQRQQRGSPSGA